MPDPVSRHELVRKLRNLGFEGPVAGAKHEFLVKVALKVRIPNPHRGDISKYLVTEILHQAGISSEDWDNI